VPLLCKELADIGEGFEFEGIACGIEEEHGCLFADFAFEADVGLDDKSGSGVAETLGESFPLLHREDYTEVRDGDVVAVDGIVMRLVAVGGRLEVRDDLVAEEIEVDPLCGAAAFGAAEGGSIECAGGVEVINGKGDVKRGERHSGLLASIIRCLKTLELRLQMTKALVVAA
jgi:hypothetical protein